MIDPLDPLDPRTLQVAREARGLSRAELARRAGTAETTILRIEAGKDPRATGTWRPIVVALNDVPLAAA